MALFQAHIKRDPSSSICHPAFLESPQVVCQSCSFGHIHIVRHSSAGCVCASGEDLIFGWWQAVLSDAPEPAWSSSLSWIHWFSHPALPSLLVTLNEFGGWHVEWEIRRFGWGGTSEWFKHNINTTGLPFKFGLTSNMRKSRDAESQQLH